MRQCDLQRGGARLDLCQHQSISNGTEPRWDSYTLPCAQRGALGQGQGDLPHQLGTYPPGETNPSQNPILPPQSLLRTLVRADDSTITPPLRPDLNWGTF